MDLDSLPKCEAGFIVPMECLAVTRLPDGPEWLYEIKLDGYRAIAINSNGKLSFFSTNRKSFSRQYPYIIEALSDLRENTVIDGEVVALDDAGRPDFNLLQGTPQRRNPMIRHVVIIMAFFLLTQLLGQSPPTAAPAAQQAGAASSPAKSIGMFAYPKNDQTADQQLKDENECFGSAKQQSGIDPQAPPPATKTEEQKKAEQQAAADNAKQAKGDRIRHGSDEDPRV
jgi:hypothetical protein